MPHLQPAADEALLCAQELWLLQLQGATPFVLPWHAFCVGVLVQA